MPLEWYGNFWIALAQHIADAGYKPCAFSVPVGNPPGDQAYIHGVLDRIVPALRKCKELGGAWSYHAYTGPYTKDIGVEIWYSLRYRQFYSYFASNYPDLNDLPIILTEGGVDTGGNPVSSGWQAHGDAAKYQDWLAWYDSEIRNDPYVVGVTLFQSGDAGGWPSFEIEPVAGWIAAHLAAAAPPPAISRSPASLSATVPMGSTDTRTFTISNSGGGTFSYTLITYSTWLQLQPGGGTCAGETDTITATLNPAGMVPGTYPATIIIMSPDAVNAPQTVSVTMTVKAPPVPGDTDGDGDVDGVDFTAFLLCMTGPGGGLNYGCSTSDLDEDNDVDQTDFGRFQRCLTGHGVIGTTDCDQ